MPAAALQRAARAALRRRAATTTAAGLSTAAAAAAEPRAEPRAEPHAKPHARHHAKHPAPPPPRAHGTLHVEELGFGRAGALSPAAAATAQVPTAVVLHGLLGAGRNLQSFSKQLLERAARAGESDWRGLLLDLRCHGRSAGGPGLEGPHTLSAAAADVARTLAAAGAGAPGGAGWVLIGHSLGGKVGLELVRQLAEGGELAGAGLAPPRQLWVLDAHPGAPPPPPAPGAPGGADATPRVLDFVAALPRRLESRERLLEDAAAAGFSRPLASWLAGALVGGAGAGFEFPFDVAGARALFDDYAAADLWPLLHAPPEGVAVHFVRALRNAGWEADPGALRRLAAAFAAAGQPARAGRGTLALHELDSGHWVHAEAPGALVDAMLPHLAELAAPPP